MRLNRTSTFIIAVALTLVLCPLKSFGWGDGGHMAIALRAWNEMTPEMRVGAIALLKQHPRYEKDFMPKLTPDMSKEDQDLRIFTYAASWPDYVWPLRLTDPRDFKKYFHAGWHTIGEEVSLEPSLQDGMPVIQKTTSKDINSWNVRDALPFVTSQLNDKTLPAADRAVALCWVMHLTGDLHQPCHSASLCCKRFPEPDGDHVATKIPVLSAGHATGLHQYWDSLYGTSSKLDDLKKWDQDIVATPALQRSALSQLSSDTTLETWVAESFAAAKESVYDKTIRDAISAQEADPTAAFKPIVLTDEYMAHAREVGRVRGILAGYRLADTLKKVDWGTDAAAVTSHP